MNQACGVLGSLHALQQAALGLWSFTLCMWLRISSTSPCIGKGGWANIERSQAYSRLHAKDG